MGTAARKPPRDIGTQIRTTDSARRYTLFDQISSGGMGSVHYGRFVGPAGFARTVAIKRLHPHLANESDFVSMLADEARLASRIRHPNVVSTVDVIESDEGLLVVMDYVHGESLSRLLRASVAMNKNPPPGVIVAIMTGALRGLHAAHEARSESGEPLEIIHRDVSPQNILVGADGQARVFDFGVAKAAGRLTTTREGLLKGKLAYMAPEQIQRDTVDRRCDIYAASVVLWEGLVGSRLFDGLSEGALVHRILNGPILGPSRAPRHDKGKALTKTIEQGSMDVLDKLDAVVLRGLARNPAERYATAREMAVALEAATKVASVEEVEEWVASMAGPVLAERARVLHVIETQQETTSGISEAPVTARDPGASNEALQSGAANTVDGLSDVRPPRSPPRSRSALGIAAIALVLLGGLYFAWRKLFQETTRAAASSAPPAALPQPSATAPPSTFNVAVEAPPVPLPPPTTSGSSPQPVPPVPILSSDMPVRPRPPRACRTVSFFDSDGVKHFKQECP
jgi:eukaryotic-like serine/threonine-protein kinase